MDEYDISNDHSEVHIYELEECNCQPMRFYHRTFGGEDYGTFVWICRGAKGCRSKSLRVIPGGYRKDPKEKSEDQT